VEANSYPPDEAASPEALAFRQESAGDFFLVGFQSGTAPDGGDEMIGQGLTLVLFSAQPELPRLVTEATASVHFSAQPETLLPMTPPYIYIAH